MKRLENVPYDLGGGQLTIHCRYGNILPTKSNAIYYKGNMASSGVELRINGRAIEHGLFDRVWGEAILFLLTTFLYTTLTMVAK